MDSSICPASRRFNGFLFLLSGCVCSAPFYGCSQIDARMPDGYPPITQPGEIQIKQYPATRAAVYRTEADFDAGPYEAFRPLFRHIKNSDIAMTAPVISEYPPESAGEQRAGRMSISFVYPNTRIGKTGQTQDVTVLDMPPLKVVSIGVRGAYKMHTMKPAMSRLADWLKAHEDEWKVSAPPRRLFYNNPLWRLSCTLYSEVQIPVVPTNPAPRTVLPFPQAVPNPVDVQ